MQEERFQTIGKSQIRVDAFDKVTGRARYADDLSMPRMLYAGCIHSIHPHAKVTIDKSKALALNGVAAVLTREDFPKSQSNLDFYYCTDEPKFIGDVIAVAAADSPDRKSTRLNSSHP